MAVLLFVLFWVLVAIGLVLMGIRSGKRGKASDNPARGGRAHWYIGFALVVLLFGAGVPIASSLGRKSDSKSNPSAGVRDLTDEQEEGRDLFVTYCALCHSLDAVKAVAQVGPDLDTLRPTAPLVLDAIKNGRARGNGAMARNLVIGDDAEHVAEFVAKAVGQEEELSGDEAEGVGVSGESQGGASGEATDGE